MNDNDNQETPLAAAPPVDEAVNEPIACPVCGKVCASPGGLRVHTLRVHEGRKWSRHGADESAASKRRAAGDAARARRAASVSVPAAVAPEELEGAGESSVIEFCPKCGCHVGQLARVLAASEAVDQQG